MSDLVFCFSINYIETKVTYALGCIKTPGYCRHLPLVNNNENQAFNLAKHSTMTDNEDPSAQFSFRLSTLQNASCAEEEILALQKLREALLPAGDEASSDEDECEKEWLRKGLNDIRNPFPSESPESFILLQEDLDSFTFYLFERRFGWSEYTANLDDYYSVADEHLGRRGSSGSLRMQDESKFKGKLNELLDEFLKW